MKRNRVRQQDVDASRALDLLVLDLVKTLAKPSVDERTQGPPQAGRVPRPAAPASEASPTTSGRRPTRGEPGRDGAAEPPSTMRDPAMPRKDARATIAGESMTGDRANLEDERLLDPEEEEFVTRTADWLSRRNNPDELLAIIWTLVTEADPESFYRPESPLPSPSEEAPDGEAGPVTADPETASTTSE
jgi:hypothetical protein